MTCSRRNAGRIGHSAGTLVRGCPIGSGDSFAVHLQDRPEHECLSRFVSKFVEAGMEKVDRLMDLFMDYTQRWVGVGKVDVHEGRDVRAHSRYQYVRTVARRILKYANNSGKKCERPPSSFATTVMTCPSSV